MTDFTIASFNVKNLIEADQEYYRFERYTPEEYAWKEDWLADQLLALDADIVCFQEIFTDSALRAVIAEADRMGDALNAEVIPGRNKRYRRKAIFRKLAFDGYKGAHLAFAPNASDGGPGERRPGLAILSRFPFEGAPEIIQDLDPPLSIDMSGGSYTLPRVSRPILKVRVRIGDDVVTIFNCHLKSKLGEYSAPTGQLAPEVNLVDYDPVGRAIGSARSAMRRMAEASVLRRAVVDELGLGRPVLVLGDMNDNEGAVSSEIISGEHPFKNYAWMRRHDAKHAGDRYTDAEDATIREQIEAVRLHSAEKLFVRKSLRDMVYTAAFGGVYESIDQILMSRHFLGELGEMTYFSVFNDHLTDGSHAEAPYNKLASDHGQIMAHFRLGK